MEISEIKELMKAAAENGLTSFELEEGNLKLSIKKERDMEQPVAMAAVSSQNAAREGLAGSGVKMPSPDSSIDSEKIVASPLVGTFYNSPSPEAEIFVKAGDTVKKGQTMGIIEAMKLMNEIESEYDGVVEAVLVGNEEVVEYGQPLFRIR